MIRPLNDRVLVRKIEEPETPEGSLIVRPDVAKNPSQRGVVLAVGQGRAFDGPGQRSEEEPDTGKVRYITYYLRQAMLVKEGDIVLWGAFSGTEVEVDGKTLFLLREDELIALDDDPPAWVKASLEQEAEPAVA